MKRKIAIATVAVVALFFLFREGRHAAIDWYFHTYYQRTTPFPAGPRPDHIVLTWSGNPETTQAINWRTSPAISAGIVEYRRTSDPESDILSINGRYAMVEDKLLINDPNVNRWTAELKDLEPGTTYTYRVSNGTAEGWSAWADFTTAPASPEPFSFVYLGDPQKGLDDWGKLVEASYKRFPASAFYVIAGDLVNDGNWRNEWDEFFAGSTSVFGRVPVMPCLGNHDVDDNMEAKLYLESFALPQDGPSSIGPERAFSFTYSNAFFIVLDSNLSAAGQAPWLEAQLASTTATWKFAMCHHPSYSSAPHRDNEDVRNVWGPLFDKYHVDMVLQGHDHAYLRTFPMNAGKRVGTAAEGTYYVVSVSGTKFYEQVEHDYAEVAISHVMTYQTIDIASDPDRLTYRAYDIDGNMRDEMVIEKQAL